MQKPIIYSAMLATVLLAVASVMYAGSRFAPPQLVVAESGNVAWLLDAGRDEVRVCIRAVSGLECNDKVSLAKLRLREEESKSFARQLKEASKPQP